MYNLNMKQTLYILIRSFLHFIPVTTTVSVQYMYRSSIVSHKSISLKVMNNNEYSKTQENTSIHHGRVVNTKVGIHITMLSPQRVSWPSSQNYR